MIARSLIAFLSAGVCLVIVSPAGAQPLGTFRWQLQPYCNVVTLAVTQIGAQYRFEGFDDLCGGPARAAVTGLAVFNPDGTLEFGWTIVSAAGPQHVDVTFSIGPLGGPWRDSGGNTGTLVFNPGAVAGPPRPGGLGAIAINPAQVQARVTGSCGASQFVQAVNADGSVSCGSDASGPGTITGVTAGTGLSGGGIAGAVTLNVAYGGPGAAPTAARSDHTHAAAGAGSVAVGRDALSAATGEFNTAVGTEALHADTSGRGNTGVGYQTLLVTTTGSNNTAIGAQVLLDNVDGSENTAVGFLALRRNVSGTSNVAIGSDALFENTNGSENVAIGMSALGKATTGSSNVAIGLAAGSNVTTGSSNIVIGRSAGSNLTTGSTNIHIGGSGSGLLITPESLTTRIGQQQTRAFIAGISGASVTGSQVVVNASGQLGVPASSARFKENVEPMGDVSHIVQALRPVSFLYKPGVEDGPRVKHYGLIAEEAAAVLPDLALRDESGEVFTLRSQFLAPLLLAEVQRLERARARMEEELARLRELLEKRSARGESVDRLSWRSIW